VQPAFVSRVFELLQLHATRAVVPAVSGWRHPLAAAYRVDVLREAQAMFAEDRLRMMELLDRVAACEISAEELMSCDPELLSLRNLNTQHDYHAALTLLAANPTEVSE
jgi:molybdopterin-guanine dinucleotide biosynthesis protein A